MIIKDTTTEQSTESILAKVEQPRVPTTTITFIEADLTEMRKALEPVESKLRFRCATCGSEDVKMDAYASWNYELQMWEVDNVFDKGRWCDRCEGECSVIEVKVSDKIWNVCVGWLPMSYGDDFKTQEEALIYAKQELEKAIAESERRDCPLEDVLDDLTCENSITGELYRLDDCDVENIGHMDTIRWKKS